VYFEKCGGYGRKDGRENDLCRALRHLLESHVIRKHSFHEDQIMLDRTILYMAEVKLPAYVPVTER